MDFLLNLLSVVFELLIYYFFFKFFFERTVFSKSVMIGAYAIAGAVSLALSIMELPDFFHRFGYYVVIWGLAFCYTGNTFIKLFIPFLFQTVSIMVERSCYLLLSPQRALLQPYGELGQYFEYFTGIVLSNLIILLLVRLLCAYKNYIFLKNENVKIPFFYCVLAIFPLGMLYITDEIVWLAAKAAELTLATVMSILVVIGITLAFFFWFDELLKSISKQQKIELLGKQIEQEKEYHAIVLDRHQQFQELRHDMRQQYDAIAVLLKSGYYEEALKYIETQSDILLNTSVPHTGQPLIDAVITIKQEQARQDGILLQSYIATDLQNIGIATDDLASILANLLENAIEATQRVRNADKKIWMQITQDREYLFVTIKNTVDFPVVIRDNIIETTKDDKKMHGLGLSIVGKNVQKYGGSYQLQCDNNIFTVRVLIPICGE